MPLRLIVTIRDFAFLLTITDALMTVDVNVTNTYTTREVGSNR
jgi:hypothetical protein